MNHRGERGFALIEVVVAAAIVAGMMGLIYQTIAANAQAAAMVRERRGAALLARSVLDQATAAPDAADLVRSGRADGFVWQVATDAWQADTRSSGPPLERVSVAIRDAGGRPVLTLQTLRLAR